MPVGAPETFHWKRFKKKRESGPVLSANLALSVLMCCAVIRRSLGLYLCSYNRGGSIHACRKDKRFRHYSSAYQRPFTGPGVLLHRCTCASRTVHAGDTHGRPGGGSAPR